MPLPLLAPLIGLGGKLVSSLFNGKGKARREARRASGKRGLGGRILGGIGKLFRRRRNKSQRLQSSSDRIFARDVKKAGRRDRRNDRKFARQIKKLGGVPPDERELPPNIDVQKVGGYRSVQEFQAPKGIFDSIKSAAGFGSDEPQVKTAGMDSKTMLMVGGAIALGLLFMNMNKK